MCDVCMYVELAAANSGHFIKPLMDNRQLYMTGNPQKDLQYQTCTEILSMLVAYSARTLVSEVAAA